MLSQLNFSLAKRAKTNKSTKLTHSKLPLPPPPHNKQFRYDSSLFSKSTKWCSLVVVITWTIIGPTPFKHNESAIWICNLNSLLLAIPIEKILWESLIMQSFGQESSDLRLQPSLACRLLGAKSGRNKRGQMRGADKESRQKGWPVEQAKVWL